MTISTGSRLGPYEVLSPLGAGGMGEVWKARETRASEERSRSRAFDGRPYAYSVGRRLGRLVVVDGLK
jgi:hypothetical protein